MNKAQRISSACIAGYAITALGILMVGLIWTQGDVRPSSFWFRLLWTEILALLVWGTTFSFFYTASDRGKGDRELIGVLPGVKLLFVAYALMSFTMMLIDAYDPIAIAGRDIHLILQVGLAVLIGIIVSVIAIAPSSAGSGLETAFENGLSPKDLAEMLKSMEMKMQRGKNAPKYAQTMASIKALREKIQYSIPKVGLIGSLDEYRIFSSEVKAVCHDIDNLGNSAEGDVCPINEKLGDLLLKAQVLSGKVISQ